MGALSVDSTKVVGIEWPEGGPKRANWISRADFYAALRSLEWEHIDRIELLDRVRFVIPDEAWIPKGYE